MTLSSKKPPKKQIKKVTLQNSTESGIVVKTRSLFRQVRKFSWDLLGTFLILVGILSILGQAGLSRGNLIDSWIRFLSENLGWGSYIFALILIYLGIGAFVYSAGKKFPISFGRVIAVEGMFFTLLPILSLVNGLSLDRAIAGQDGGTLGWGLGQAVAAGLSVPGALIIYGLLFILFLLIGTGSLQGLLAIARSWGQQKPVENVTSTNKGTEDLPISQQIAGEPEPNPVSQRLQENLPPVNILFGEQNAELDQGIIQEKGLLIESKLAEFGIPVKVIGYRMGPTVTQFALEPGYLEKTGPDGEPVQQKVKVSQISALQRDLALALSATRLRIETPVPGRSYVGIEIPNDDSSFVRLRPVLESTQFQKLQSPLAIGLGKNVSGETVAVDLEKMPHMLVAGTTNSGKSVCITSIISCLAMNNSPENLRLVMLDPKMVELVRFNGLPHVMGQVETRLERMLAVLQWAQAEMDARYRMLEHAQVRNIESYNQKMRQRNRPTMPRIVIFIDEMADMMMSAPDQTEHSLTRLAQMARATGMHLVVATQRPSTDVVTGLIKANFPARIAFAVPSSIDSRVILDANGAENLLGRGDMLFLDPSKSGLQRLQGVIVSDLEIERILLHWQKVKGRAPDEPAPWEELVSEAGAEDSDRLVEQAIAVVRTAGKASTSLLQRRLHVGYPRAARLIDQLEEMGIVGPSVGSGRERDVLDDEDETDADDYDSRE
ncbi:MAG TPA: DNA translocase FtsK [Anaerolineaceae bacterium]|nr:DNA translocase FtsK [Anaerolineaceae bacterium]